MDKIEKIRRKLKELRELLEDHNYYLDNSEQALGYGLALDDIEKSLDTFSEEPDKSLEDEIIKYLSDRWKFGCCTPVTPVVLPNYTTVDLRKCANHFAEWGAEHLRDTTKMIDKSLEEAAEEKYPVYWKSYPKDGIVRSESSYDTNKQCRDAFIAGAEWQARQLLQGSPMSEDTVLFNKGVEEGRRLEREDMLKDAMEGYVNYYEDSGGILMAEAQVGCPYHNGDKVRIVVLKAEEESE